MWRVLVALASAALFLGAATSASAGTLDQQQTNAGGFTDPTELCFPICNDVSEAQTFTAGLSGVLDQVDLVVDRQAGTSAPLTVEIRTVTSDCPSNTVLASRQFGPIGVPVGTGSTPPFTPIPFSNGATVVAGTQYAVDFYTASGNTYTGYGSASDSYPPGQACGSGSPPSTWSPDPTLDFAFKTYVGPPAPPNTGQRAAALASCKKRAHTHHWSKKRLRKCRKKAKLLPV